MAVDQAVGERRRRPARLERPDGAGQHPHADEKRLLLSDDAGAVEDILVVGGVAQAPSG